MKKTRHIGMLFAGGLLACLATTAKAQITTPFPTGINLFSGPTYASNVGHYASALGSLYFASSANVPGEIGSNLNGWTNTPLSLATQFGGNPWLAGGGTVKVVYLGETAAWKNDFGYVSSAAPSVYNALVTDVVGQGNIISGSETYVNYMAGTTLDFFLNSGGPLSQGGLFYAFGTGNQYSGTDLSSHIKWKIMDVMTTFLDSSNVLTTALMKTLLIGFEDTRQGVSFYDGDSNDFVVAFQFMPPQFITAVPEPATYGIIGALALAGLAGWRRFTASRAQRRGAGAA